MPDRRDTPTPRDAVLPVKSKKIIKFKHTEDGGWIVLEDGDRLGIVRCLSRGRWVAVDTYFVGLRNVMKSRASAVAALQRRAAANAAKEGRS